MKNLILLGASAAAWPLSALADPVEGWRDGYGHMMWGGGYGIFGGLMMLVFWGVLIVLIVLAVRWLSDSRSGTGRRDAIDVLRERFAAGEIDEEEFRRRKRALEE